MRPAQIGTQCVPIWKRKIKLPHIPKISLIKTFSEFFCQFLG